MRKVNSLKNFLTSVIPYFVIAVLGFVRIRVFVDCLGNEINALNQLFFQIFNYISLVEAGVGTLVTQRYYKLLIDDDKDTMNLVYSSSVKMLRKVSLIIFAMGVVISFFLEFLTNNTLSLGYMQFVFILFLLRAISEYLMLSPRFLLQADQKIYKINVWINVYRVLEYVVEIGWLYLGGDYIAILLATIVIRIFSYWFTNRKVFREYPWLHYEKDAPKIAIKGMDSVFMHKVSGTVYENTDILLISSFLNPLTVTIYSSYNTIIKFVNDMVILLSTAVTASFGNVMYKDEEEQRYRTFREMNILFFYCAAVFVIVLYYVTNSFVVNIWLGEQYRMVELGFTLMLALLFHNIARRPLLVLKDACAMFRETRMIALLEAVLNLALSFILVQKMGLVGVLLATVIATAASNFWFYPIYMFRNVFHQSYWIYFGKYAFTAAYVVLLCLFSQIVLPFPQNAGILLWLIIAAFYGIGVVCLTFFVFTVVFSEFRELVRKSWELLKVMMKKVKRT